MKRLIAPAWLTAWLAGWLPDSIFKLGKKAPWYRQSLIADIPWVAVVLAAPLVLFLGWKGIGVLRSSNSAEQG